MSKINETNYPRRTQASYEDTDMLVIQKSGGNTYTTRIEDLREDCQETLAPALNTMRENLATVEGSTASKAYAKGDFLVFGGRLCKAKTSIAVNATLVLDTNIELASVGGELSSISSDLTSQITVARHENNYRCQYARYLRVVQIRFTEVTGGTTFSTPLPANVRPLNNLYFPLVRADTSGINGSVMINTDGSISINAPADGQYYYGVCVYFTNG